MLFKYIYTLPNTTSGADGILVNVVSVLPAFTPLILAFVFFFVFLGGSARQKARNGEADYPMWSVVASIGMLMTALILSMATGLIQLGWLVIVVVITIFSGVWLFLNRKD